MPIDDVLGRAKAKIGEVHQLAATTHQTLIFVDFRLDRKLPAPRALNCLFLEHNVSSANIRRNRKTRPRKERRRSGKIAFAQFNSACASFSLFANAILRWDIPPAPLMFPNGNYTSMGKQVCPCLCEKKRDRLRPSFRARRRNKSVNSRGSKLATTIATALQATDKFSQNPEENILLQKSLRRLYLVFLGKDRQAEKYAFLFPGRFHPIENCTA